MMFRRDWGSFFFFVCVFCHLLCLHCFFLHCVCVFCYLLRLYCLIVALFFVFFVFVVVVFFCLIVVSFLDCNARFREKPRPHEVVSSLGILPSLHHDLCVWFIFP